MLGDVAARQSKFVVYFSISSLQCHVVFVFLISTELHQAWDFKVCEFENVT